VAVMTGKTDFSKIPYPIPNIDIFDPAGAVKELAESVDSSFKTAKVGTLTAAGEIKGAKISAVEASIENVNANKIESTEVTAKVVRADNGLYDSGVRLGASPFGFVIKSESDNAIASGAWRLWNDYTTEPVGRIGGMSYSGGFLITPVPGIYRIYGQAVVELAPEHRCLLALGFTVRSTNEPDVFESKAVYPANGNNVEIIEIEHYARLAGGTKIGLNLYQDSQKLAIVKKVKLAVGYVSL